MVTSMQAYNKNTNNDLYMKLTYARLGCIDATFLVTDMAII